MSNFQDCNGFLDNIDEIIEKKIKLYLQTNDCLQKRLVKIATVVGDTSSVYFPPIYDVESSVFYPNKTGETLTNGDWVYLFVSFSNPDQGWIMIKK